MPGIRSRRAGVANGNDAFRQRGAENGILRCPSANFALSQESTSSQTSNLAGAQTAVATTLKLFIRRTTSSTFARLLNAEMRK